MNRSCRCGDEINSSEIEIIDYFTRKLLANTASLYFGSGTQRLLEATVRPVLIGDLERGLRQAFENDQQPKAAIFLDPIARVYAEMAWPLITTLPWDSTVSPSLMFDIADAVAHIKTIESRQVLKQLLTDQGPGVADRAIQTLRAHSTES